MRTAIFLGMALLAGCVANLPHNTPTLSNGTPPPSGVTAAPAPSGATAAPSTGPCATSAPDAQQIGMTLEIAIPTATPSPYGYVSGYGLIMSGQIANSEGAVIFLRPSDKVQFYNTDTVTGRLLSAAGIAESAVTPGGAFPATYAFPTSAARTNGSVIGPAGSWSTGLVNTGCYSQEFNFSGAGTYYFGDVTYYGENVRDVFVVSASAAQTAHRLLKAHRSSGWTQRSWISIDAKRENLPGIRNKAIASP